MFRLALTNEQNDLCATLRKFSKKEIRAVFDGDGGLARDSLSQVWTALNDMGLTRSIAVEPDGDSNPDLLTSLLVAEETAVGDPGVAYELVVRAAATTMIDGLGSPEQRARYLPRLSDDADFSASLAYFEGFGRSPLELATSAVRDSGRWQLSGSKIGVIRPGGPGVLVVIGTDPASRRLTAFAVDPVALPGITVDRDDNVVGKLGLEAAATGNITLDLAGLEDSERLALGSRLDLHRLIAGLRLAVAATCIGTARAALAYASDYANSRVAFGGPIAQYQGVAFPLAEVDGEIHAARLQAWRAAEAIGQSEDIEEIVKTTDLAVANCQRLALSATRIGVNTLGGHGFVQDHPAERWYRAAATLAALDFDPLVSDCDVF